MWTQQNSSDPSILEPRVAQLESNFAEAAIQSKQIKKGANTIMVAVASPVKVTAYGRTLVNLLGNAGNFKDLNGDGLADGWSKGSVTNGKWSIVAATTFGGRAQRIDSLAGDTSNTTRNIAFSISAYAGKYYVALTYVVTDGTSRAEIGFGSGGNVGRNTSGILYKKNTIAADGTLTVYHNNFNAIGVVGWVSFEASRIYEVDAATYAKIDVDPEYTGDKLAEKFPYVDGTKHAQGVGVKKTGKNLVPQFTDSAWSIHGNAVINGPYSLTLNATAGNQRSLVEIPVIPGQLYSYKYTQTGGGVSVCWFYDNKGTQLTADNYTATATAPANAATMKIGLYGNGAGTFSFDNLICIPGTPVQVNNTIFEPYNADYVYLPTVLASNLDGSVRDTAYERENVWYKYKKWSRLTLDGSIAWINHAGAGAFAGSQRVYFNTLTPAGLTGSDNRRVTKHDGTQVLNVDPGQATDAVVFGGGNVYMSAANALTGFGDTHVPTNQDWKNYFNGWKMNNGTLGTAYPGTGTKYWTAIESPRANFVGKVAGSTVENANIARRGAQATLQTPSAPIGEITVSGDYSNISLLDGTVQASGSNATGNGNIGQTMFSFNLIEHVLRKYGSAIFNGAGTTTAQVTWLKANIGRLAANWYGYGSGPAGNKATLTVWRSDNTWQSIGIPTSTTNAVSKLQYAANASWIDANGFIHYLVYADASDGVTASTVFTDFIDLEVELNVQVVPATGLATTEFKPYTLDYVLATPVEEVIPGGEGAISLAQGGNQVELFEGLVWREKVVPSLGATAYHINNSDTNNGFKMRASKILAVYRNGVIDPKWVVAANSTDKFGAQRAACPIADYDTTAEYTVTYIVTDKHLFTVNAIEAKVEYNSTRASVQNNLVQQAADNTTNIEILVRSMAEMYKRVKALGG